MSGELTRWNAMNHAIAVCHSVDEVKGLKDKALALELYAKQTKNTDAERKACEVRLRAERRTGELLKELARTTPAQAGKAGGHAKAGTTNDAKRQATPYAEALSRTGLSFQTASRYQALADVPAETFETALRDPVKPTTNALLAKAAATKVVQDAKSAPKMPADALWLWGRARDFERDGYFVKHVGALLAPMTETMRADMRRIVPLWAAFINEINEELAR